MMFSSNRSRFSSFTRRTAFGALFTLVPIAGFLALSAAAFAQQSVGTVTINDLGTPITATQVGGTNGVNDSITADVATPETISGSFPIDGLVVGATGYSVLLDPTNTTEVSDLLTVQVTPNGLRGMGINYFTASWTYMSADNGASIDLTTLGLAQNVIDKIIAAGQAENGKQQTMTGNMLDSNGNAIGVGGLTVTAASNPDMPEPTGTAAMVLGSLLTLAATRRKRAR